MKPHRPSVLHALPVVFALGLCVAPRASSQESTVTIPLKEYESLTQSTQGNSLTILDSIRVSGSIKRKDLKLTIRGRSLGRRREIELVKSEGQFALSQCQGDAVLYPENGIIHMLPTKDPFSVTCAVGPREQERLRLVFPSPALQIAAQVEDGEAIIREVPGEGTSVVITSLAGAAEKEARPPIASGRYRLSLLPNQSSFDYAFTIDNPNRSKLGYALVLPNNEAVRSVSTTTPYREEDGKVMVDLLPGPNQVEITGTFSGDRFRPPLPFDEQYLVLENHPMFAVAVKTKARRISPADTGIGYAYSSAQGFLLSEKDELSWAITKMQVFSSLGFTLSNLHYLVFLPAVGRPVVEARMAIENQGTPQLSLSVPGTPTYLEINGKPQLLYKDDEGNLAIPLSIGSQALTVQYESVRTLRFFNFLESARLLTFNSPISSAELALRAHRKWTPLGASFSRYLYSPLSFLRAAWRAALCAGFWWFLRRFGFGRGRSWLFAGALFLLSLYSPWWMVVPGLIVAAVGLLRAQAAGKVSRELKVGLWVCAALAACVLLIAGIVAITQRGYRSTPEDLLSGSQMGGGAVDARSLADLRSAGSAAQQIEGLPAKVLIPPAERPDITFQESMVASGKALKMRCFMAPALLMKLLGVMAAAVLILLFWSDRHRFAGILKDAYGKARAARPAEAAAAAPPSGP